MPIYEYVCDDCGYDFERMQSFSEEALQSCPECQGHVRRVISSVGVIFKGSGWYITDSKRHLSSTSGGGRKALTDGRTGDGEGASEGAGASEGTGTAAEKGTGKSAEKAAAGDSVTKGAPSAGADGGQSKSGGTPSASAGQD